MIPGWSTERQSWSGRAGITIPEFGSTVPFYRLESVSESVSFQDLVGAGTTGDSIGITTRSCTTTPGTTRPAELSTTEMFITAAATGDPMRPAAGPPRMATCTTVRAEPLSPSRGIIAPLEDTTSPEPLCREATTRVEPDRALSAITIMAESQGATPRGEAPVWAAITVGAGATVGADTTDGKLGLILQEWRD
jgi:hypothetical protein